MKNLIKTIFFILLPLIISYSLIWVLSWIGPTQAPPGGSGAISVDSLGNVGIGTTTPTQKLDVNGTIKATAYQGDGSQLTGVSGVPSGSSILSTSSIPSSGYSYTNDYINAFNSFTKLLLHADGSNGSISFFDSSGTNKSVTAYGNAQISTAQSKFGGASASFDGTGDYLSIPDSDDWNFGAGDFTMDTWVRYINYSGYQKLINQWSSGDASYMLYSDGSTLRFFWSTNGNPSGAPEIFYSWTPTLNIWYHIAVVRNSTNISIYINGINVVSGNIGTSNLWNSSIVLTIGTQLDGPGYLNGYLDEVRITKGLARWTSNFTPPTQPYGTYYIHQKN